MTDIFLYRGETSPNDIKLRDTTLAANAPGIPLDSGGAAPRSRQVYYQSLFLPVYVAAAVAVVQPQGWAAPLSIAPPIEKAAQDFGSVPASVFVVVTVDKWQQPLSVAVLPAKAQAGHASVPYNTAQLSVNFTNFGWHGPTSTAAPVAKAQPGFALVPFDTRQLSVNFTTTGWESQPPAAPPVAKAQLGFAFVPYNTAQLSVNFTNYGWYLPLSPAPAVAKAIQGDSFVPYNTAQLVVAPYTNFWLQPLSGAPPVAKAIQGDAFVPFNTTQIVAASGIPLDMGGAALRLRTVYYQSNFVPPYVVPVVVAAYTNFWLQPLSVAVPVAKAAAPNWSLPYTIISAAGVAWQSPLASAAPSVARAAQSGFADVPLFYTAAQVAGIAGIAWFSPLGTIPPRILAAQQGNSFVPYNTAQTVVTATGRRKPLLFISNVGRLMN